MFDPLSKHFYDNPYKVYAQLRELDKPYFYAERNMWLLSRYDDISQLTLSPHAVRSLRGLVSDQELSTMQQDANWHEMPYHQRLVQFSLLDSDGDVHHRLRRWVFKSFTPKRMAKLEPMIIAYVQGLINELGDQPQIDFVNDFAAYVPGFVIAKFLGVPEEDCDLLRNWSEKIVRFFDVNRNASFKQDAEQATSEFYHYLLDLKLQRTRHPKDDLISNMILEQSQHACSEDEFISTCMLILMAGHGSTIDVLGSAMHILAERPDLVRHLCADKALLPPVIEEVFRFESPLPFFHRHITADIQLRDYHFDEGATFGLLYGAANRDPRQFQAPDIFNPERQLCRDLAFGRGIHLCLGNHLARLNMRAIFEVLLSRFANFELVDNYVRYKPGLTVRGPESLSIHWS